VVLLGDRTYATRGTKWVTLVSTIHEDEEMHGLRFFFGELVPKRYPGGNVTFGLEIKVHRGCIFYKKKLLTVVDPSAD
jgi:hypothetical protein